MIIAEVILGKALGVTFVDHDYMIEQIVSKTSNPPFVNSILPGAAVAGMYGRDPRRAEKLMHLDAELRISIEDQVLALGGFRKCLAKLLHDPFTGRVLGRIEVDDLSTAMADQKQAV